MNIYFICTGNTCRSPMAEAILRSKNIDNLVVHSAGIHASDGVPIADNSRTLIEEADMPYTATSKSVTADDMDWADLIFTMTDAHKRALLHSFPEAQAKIFALKEYVDPDGVSDVHDPFGGNIETYRQTFVELSAIIDAVVQKLSSE